MKTQDPGPCPHTDDICRLGLSASTDAKDHEYEEGQALLIYLILVTLGLKVENIGTDSSATVYLAVETLGIQMRL